MYWIQPTERTITNYQQAEALWAKCRSKDKGKPITGWLRMFKDGDSFLFRTSTYGLTDFAVLSPDNKMTFVATPEHVYRSAQTIVSAIHRWLPFTVQRHRKQLYRIGHAIEVSSQYEAIKGCSYVDVNKIIRQQPSYFQGIEFDMITGACLNPRPDDKLIEKSDERKEWRRLLARFKLGIKARVRVRAFDGIVDEMWAERQKSQRWDHKQPDWSSELWLDKLESAIRDNQYPQDLLMGIAQTSHTGYYMSAKPSGSDVLKATNKICNDCSIELRRRFNVFEHEVS